MTKTAPPPRPPSRKKRKTLASTVVDATFGRVNAPRYRRPGHNCWGLDGWTVGRFGPGPDVITLTSLTYVRTLEPTVALAERCSAFGVLFGFVLCSVNACSVFSVRRLVFGDVHVRCFVWLRLLHVVLFGVLFAKIGRVEFCSMLCSLAFVAMMTCFGFGYTYRVFLLYI